MTLAFDRAYYAKFYFDPRTAVTTQAEMRARARLIVAYVNHVGLPVRRILDAGCGTGMLRGPLRTAFRSARYVGLDVSEYLCGRFGWEHGSVTSWRSPLPFDLVVCYDVLQYLDDRAAARALANTTSEKTLVQFLIDEPVAILDLSAGAYFRASGEGRRPRTYPTDAARDWRTGSPKRSGR